MATIPINPIYLEADDPRVGNAWVGLTDYKFATGRFRSPTDAGTTTSGTQYTGHKVEFISPPYWTNNWRFAFPGHYTRDDGVTPSEIIMPNAYDVVGFAVHAFINNAWVVILAWQTTDAPLTVNPGVGALSPDINFPGNGVPPNTRMAVITRINVASVGHKVPVAIKNRSGTNEGASQTVVASNFLLNQTGLLGGTDGRLNGMVFSPSFGVAKCATGITRPVFWVNGDSIAYGKNENENVLPATGTGASGFLARALEDDTRSRRMAFYNSAIPGVGHSEQSTRTPWQYKLGLIELVPNRPYTHIITEHYNNSGGGDYETGFKPLTITYHAFLKTLSTFWGDAACPLFQTRVIPRPGSTDYGTSKAGQGSSGENYGVSNRWLFDRDLELGGVYLDVAAAIPTNDRLAFSQQRIAGQFDRYSIPNFTTTLATAISGSPQFINIADKPPSWLQHVVIDPGATNSARHVTSVVDNGDGTWRLNLDATVTTAESVGTVVKSSFMGDTLGLHPNTQGHKLIAEDVIDWKNDTFYFIA